MTVVGKGLEQEAVDSITLLLSNIQSRANIFELKKAIVTHEQMLLEDELEVAQKIVDDLETQLKQIGLPPGKLEEDEEEVEDKEAVSTKETLKENPTKDKRPLFSIPKFERLIVGHFCSSKWSGKEFTVSDMRNYISEKINLSIYDYTYTTKNGSNLFTACIRNSTRSLLKSGELKRIRNGVFAAEGKLRKGDLKKAGFINWIPEEM